MRRDRRAGQNIARAASNCRLTVGGRLTVDFFGVDGALEKAAADVDEALDGIGGEDRARGLRSLQAFAACKAARVRTTTIIRSADDVPSLAACRASQLENVGQAREAVGGL